MDGPNNPLLPDPPDPQAYAARATPCKSTGGGCMGPGTRDVMRRDQLWASVISNALMSF